MAVSAETIDFIKDLFRDVGMITTRAMMGGLCIYSDGKIFAILGEDEQIYLKAKGAFADTLANEGSRKFEFAKKDGKIASMGYWTLPDDALDDPELAADWGRRALLANPD